MKLAHIAVVSPRRSGLYETTRELVSAERALGVDARIYDPQPTALNPGVGKEDRGAPIADMEFVRSADIVVDHSGCDGVTDDSKQPHIYVAHGRPRASFLQEVQGGAPVYSYRLKIDAGGSRYKAVVTFWSEHVPYLEVLFRRLPVHAVPACVDLKAWTPGESTYDFHGKGGTYNVICTDVWRHDVDPFECVNAVALAAKRLSGIKLHLYGRCGEHNRGWPALLKPLRDDGVLGEVGWADNLLPVYRAADLMVTPHKIATRAVREAMACGCYVHHIADVINDSMEIEDLAGNQRLAGRRSPSSDVTRFEAEVKFDPLETARQFLDVCKSVGGAP